METTIAMEGQNNVCPLATCVHVHSAGAARAALLWFQLPIKQLRPQANIRALQSCVFPMTLRDALSSDALLRPTNFGMLALIQVTT
jgi:hypothetical protein